MCNKYPIALVVIVAMALSLVLMVPSAPAQQRVERRFAGAFENGEWPGGLGLGLLPSKPEPRYQKDLGGLGTSEPLASSVDLTGTLPPIGNQGNQGSCVGWATSYYYKTWWEKQEHPDWDLQNDEYVFSPSFVFNQIGSEGGANFEDAFLLLEEEGDVDIAEFPYTDESFSKMPTAKQEEAAKQYRIPPDVGSWRYFFKNDVTMDQGPFENDIGALKAYLNQGKPIVLGVPIFTDMPDYASDPFGGKNPASQFYDTEFTPSNPPIYDLPQSGGNFWGGHALYIAGYDDSVGNGKGGFLCVNSWGPGWNTNGRVYLGYDFVKWWVWEAWSMEDRRDSRPTIYNYATADAGPSDTLIINGDNFGADRRSSRVTFDDEEATAFFWADNLIKVNIPDGHRASELAIYDWDEQKAVTDASALHWMLAEGCTLDGFDEWVLVQNPNAEASNADVTFLTESGPVSGPNLDIPAESRVTVHVNEYLPDQNVAAVVAVTNEVPVCVERAMYFDTWDGKWGSHDSVGCKGVHGTWYLAEGATWPGFDEWVLVMNPCAETVKADVTFQTPTGEVGGPSLTLEPGTRETVHVNDHVPNQDVSTKIETKSGPGVVAERSMYIASQGRIGCHNSQGTPYLYSAWALAEGSTWPGFEEWVLVQNPTTVSEVVYLIWFTAEGYELGPAFNLGPGQRISIKINDHKPNCDVSVGLIAEEPGHCFVAERAMYFTTAEKFGAHNAPGSVFVGYPWYLPEGATWGGFDEWVLVMNADLEFEADVQLNFMTEAGLVEGPATTIPPGGRASFHVNDYVPNQNVSTKVNADGAVVCERAMYMNTWDGKHGAHDSLGVLYSDIYDTGSSGGPGGGRTLDLRELFDKALEE